MRRSVEQRLIYSLSRFGEGVERVVVRLAERSNALGGVDRRCQMRAWLKHRKSVGVVTLDGPGAIDRAVDRLAIRVEWALVNGRAETPLGPMLARRTSTGRPARQPATPAARRKSRRR